MELVCINCPMGCHLSVTKENGEVKVTGNTCHRGEKYAIDEATCPKRTLTTTVSIKHSIYDCLPVITSAQIPKDKMFDVMKELKNIEVNAPININDVIVEDVCGLGVNIIASRTLGVKFGV